MNGVTAALRRAAALLVEPAPVVRAPGTMPLEALVTQLAAGAGATTVSSGLALSMRRLRPVELAQPGRPAVAAGPGVAVVSDVEPAVVGRLRVRGPGRILVVVGDARHEPALAALVLEVLAERHERVVLVGNRARDPDAWRVHGALCVPESWFGAWLANRRRRPPGAMGTAFDALAARVQQAACDA